MSPNWLRAAPVMFLLLWSLGFSVAKIGLQYAEPMTLLALRYFCVLAIMALLFAILRPPLPTNRADWLHLAFVGFLLQTVYFSMCWLAFNRGVPVGSVALIMSFQPIIVALIAPRWTGEHISWIRWAGLGLGLIGAVFVITARSGMAPISSVGLFLAVTALAGITTASLWEKRFGKTHHPVTANFIGYGAGFLGILPFMLGMETMQINWTWQFTGALAFLVIGNSVIAIGLLLAMIRAGDVSAVSSLFFLVPPLAALIAWAMLGEVLAPIGWIGMAIAAVGVLLATRKTAS